jgi:hypothetical protein
VPQQILVQNPEMAKKYKPSSGASSFLPYWARACEMLCVKADTHRAGKVLQLGLAGSHLRNFIIGQTLLVVDFEEV